jgi:hypothetical protein
MDAIMELVCLATTTSMVTLCIHCTLQIIILTKLQNRQPP